MAGRLSDDGVHPGRHCGAGPPFFAPLEQGGPQRAAGRGGRIRRRADRRTAGAHSQTAGGLADVFRLLRPGIYGGDLGQHFFGQLPGNDGGRRGRLHHLLLRGHGPGKVPFRPPFRKAAQQETDPARTGGDGGGHRPFAAAPAESLRGNGAFLRGPGQRPRFS